MPRGAFSTLRERPFVLFCFVPRAVPSERRRSIRSVKKVFRVGIFLALDRRVAPWADEGKRGEAVSRRRAQAALWLCASGPMTAAFFIFYMCRGQTYLTATSAVVPSGRWVCTRRLLRLLRSFSLGCSLVSFVVDRPSSVRFCQMGRGGYAEGGTGSGGLQTAGRVRGDDVEITLRYGRPACALLASLAFAVPRKSQTEARVYGVGKEGRDAPARLGCIDRVSLAAFFFVSRETGPDSARKSKTIVTTARERETPGVG